MTDQDLDLNYGIVIDAGSSGSRLQIYSWPSPDQLFLKLNSSTDENDQQLLKMLPPVTQGGADWHKKTHPGISTFADSPHKIWKKHLKKLIKRAKKVIPEKKWHETPIFLQATAGMRLLPKEKQDAILGEVCNCLSKKSDFYLPDCNSHIEIISGQTEGLYGWIALNYLVGGFDHPIEIATKFGQQAVLEHHATYGFLDMGGASAQIAFAPNSTEAEKHAEDLYFLRLRALNGSPREYSVFVSTWLGYGANQARERYLASLVENDSPFDQSSGRYFDPCLPANTLDEVEVKVSISNLDANNLNKSNKGEKNNNENNKDGHDTDTDDEDSDNEKKINNKKKTNKNKNKNKSYRLIDKTKLKLSKRNQDNMKIRTKRAPSPISPPSSMVKVKVIGTGDTDQCVKNLYPLLAKEKDCGDPQCLFGGVHAPLIDYDINRFIGVSEYWHTSADVFAMGGSYNFASYSDRLRSFCKQDWDTIKSDNLAGKYAKDVDEDDLKALCFKGSWVINVLHDGFGIPRYPSDYKMVSSTLSDGSLPNENNDSSTQNSIYNRNLNSLLKRNADNNAEGFGVGGGLEGALSPDDMFQSVNNINGTELSWTLGKMVLYASSQVQSSVDDVILKEEPVGYGPGSGLDASEFIIAGEVDSNDKYNKNHDSGSWSEFGYAHRMPGIILFLFLLVGVVYLLLGRQRREKLFIRLSTVPFIRRCIPRKYNYSKGLHSNGSDSPFSHRLRLRGRQRYSRMPSGSTAELGDVYSFSDRGTDSDTGYKAGIDNETIDEYELGPYGKHSEVNDSATLNKPTLNNKFVNGNTRKDADSVASEPSSFEFNRSNMSNVVSRNASREQLNSVEL